MKVTTLKEKLAKILNYLNNNLKYLDLAQDCKKSGKESKRLSRSCFSLLPSHVFREGVITTTLKRVCFFQDFNVSKDLDNLAVKLFASLAPNLIQGYLDLCLDIQIKAKFLWVSEKG